MSHTTIIVAESWCVCRQALPTEVPRTPIPGGYCVVPEPPVRRLTVWTSEGFRGGPVKFALLYFYDPAQAGPAEGEVGDWLGLDAEIEEAGAHLYGAGF